ncbi:MAG: DUF3463 domain-containing protein, partial [Alphaproteobacteria bacterium]|nr:DUF3463 domain-containing protein [Alphaproteobacteria bacterium]
DQEHFLSRQQTKTLFRDVFRRGKGKKWKFSQSSMFLDFLAGNQEYHCTPWGNPTRNIFGWQKPCYLLGEGFVGSFRELMETTEWDNYGTGKYAKCANCMVHCGYEPTAVNDTLKRPLHALLVKLRGVKTEGPMAPEIALGNARPAQYVFDVHVQQKLAEVRTKQAASKAAQERGANASTNAA